MNILRKFRVLACLMSIWVGLYPIKGVAEDIDIFVGSSAGAFANPNVLIVFDNRSNWARNDQHFPNVSSVGWMETVAAQAALPAAGSHINVGVMEFVPNSVTNIGGYVRYAIKPMDDAAGVNQPALANLLTTMSSSVNNPDEKISNAQSVTYGGLMLDIYNYFAGNAAWATAAGVPTLADTTGYTGANYLTFRSPLSCGTACAKNFVIFISNPTSNDPPADTAANTSALSAAGGSTAQLPLPNVTPLPSAHSATAPGNTSACYASQAEAQAAYGYGFNTDTNTNELYFLSATATDKQTTCANDYAFCTIGSTATTPTYTKTCAAGTSSYNIIQTTVTPVITYGTSTTSETTPATCYPTQTDARTAARAYTQASPPSGASCGATTYSYPDADTTVKTEPQCTYDLGDRVASCTGAPNVTAPGTASSCYSSWDVASSAITPSNGDHGGMSCPTGYTCSYAPNAAGASCGTPPNATSGTTTGYYKTSDAASSDHGGLTCPSGYQCSYTYSKGSAAPGAGDTTYIKYASSLPATPGAIDNTAGSTAQSVSGTTLSCPIGNSCTYSVTTGATVANAGSASFTTNCLAPTFNPTGSNHYTYDNTTNATVTLTSISIGNGTATGSFTCAAYQRCEYSSGDPNGNSGGCGSTGNKKYSIDVAQTGLTPYTIKQTATAAWHWTFTQTPLTNYAYSITQTAVPDSPSTYKVVQTKTPKVTTSTTSRATLGRTSDCTAGAPGTVADYASQCTGTGISCAADAASASSTTNYCGDGKSQYQVLGWTIDVSQYKPTGTYSPDTHPFNADEWTQFFYRQGIPVSGCDSQKVTTYTIDTYYNKPNPTYTSLLMNMATVGGGRYYNATSLDDLTRKLKQIFNEIQSINSTFASASLPINATNRAQNENQVFIGMFRPDTNPRWFGNVKRYQLIKDPLGNIQLGDARTPSQLAVNNNTGFITDCATSWWTTDSGSYWNAYTWVTPDPAGTCPTTSYNRYSDAPDGPRVEKGGVAQMLRSRGDPENATTGRKLYAATGTAFSAAAMGWCPSGGCTTGDAALTTADWAWGRDTVSETTGFDENRDTNHTEPRASIHGDVVHSRPLPVNYATSGTGNIVIYYGANDGTLRAVDAGTGQEKWAFIAPEFEQSRFERLRLQTPAVCFPNTPGFNSTNNLCYDTQTTTVNGVTTTTLTSTLSTTFTPRNYFWDGSIGLYQTATNDKVWIFPTMRRGGRSIYALDVSPTNADHNVPPTSPVVKWRFGCTGTGTSATSCSSGAEADATAGRGAMGQSWSIPNIAKIKGYSQGTGDTVTFPPVAVVGGGYDPCEDANSPSPSCGSTTGNAVYVLNADTGAVIRSFATLRAVPGDVALIDMDFDGYPDLAYVGDTGGNLYRISFSTYSTTTGTFTPLDKDNWTITRVAYTNGLGRKFLFSPALFGQAGSVYVALGSGDREHPLQNQYPYTTSFKGDTLSGTSAPGYGLPVWNRFYVYRDCLSITRTASLSGGDDLDNPASMTNASTDLTLVTGSTTQYQNTSCGRTSTSPLNCSTNKGWFVDLNSGAGEQTVTSAVITGGMVTFSTNRPIPAATGTCANPLGKAFGYWLNLYNGSGAIAGSCTINGVALTNDPRCNCGGQKSAEFVGGGLPPSPVIGTVPIDGTPTSVVLGAVQRTGNASSPISPQKATPTNLPARKRVYSYTKGNN